ncbi:CinA family protein [Nocardia sp. NPDC051052]|uniref:CinA family protein n=1 Tax=Nocardia sp. NPDC051052 TaxID=3364322 RepID=UPI0037B7AAA1
MTSANSRHRVAEQLARAALGTGQTVAVAESLTAGQLAAAVGAAPDAGSFFRGSVVGYSRRVKHKVLGVPDGPVVSEHAAEAMARTVKDLMDADIAVAVTGVGGPDTQDGEPPGTVWFAVATETSTKTSRQLFPGDPGEVLRQTVDFALELLVQAANEPKHGA